MSEELTKKQKEFADEYLETGNGTKSALKAYDTDKERVAASIGSENLTKPNIKAYLETNAEAVAINMVRLALNAERESDQISAGKDVLDRAGHKPVDKSESTVTVVEPIMEIDEVRENNSHQEDNSIESES